MVVQSAIIILIFHIGDGNPHLFADHLRGTTPWSYDLGYLFCLRCSIGNRAYLLVNYEIKKSWRSSIFIAKVSNLFFKTAWACFKYFGNYVLLWWFEIFSFSHQSKFIYPVNSFENISYEVMYCFIRYLYYHIQSFSYKKNYVFLSFWQKIFMVSIFLSYIN